MEITNKFLINVIAFHWKNKNLSVNKLKMKWTAWFARLAFFIFKNIYYFFRNTFYIRQDRADFESEIMIIFKTTHTISIENIMFFLVS